MGEFMIYLENTVLCNCQTPQPGGMVMPSSKREIRELLARYTQKQIDGFPELLYLQKELHKEEHKHEETKRP
jgi:hypothetical protein